MSFALQPRVFLLTQRLKLQSLRYVVLTAAVTVLLFLCLHVNPRLRGLFHASTPFNSALPRNSSACSPSLRFSDVPLPVTALCSVQGSGNTWMRHLLQQLTGIYTGSIYDRRGDWELWMRGYRGEGVQNGSVVAVKTHGLPGGGHYDRAVLLLRNPYDAVLADFNRRATGSHTGLAPTWVYMKRWNTFVTEFAKRWAEFHMAWKVNFTGPLLLVNFDGLVQNLGHEMERVVNFLTHPALETNISCAIEGSKGVFRRGSEKLAFHKKDLFSPEQIAFINTKIDFVRSLFVDKFSAETQIMTRWKLTRSSAREIWASLPRTIF